MINQSCRALSCRARAWSLPVDTISIAISPEVHVVTLGEGHEAFPDQCKKLIGGIKLSMEPANQLTKLCEGLYEVNVEGLRLVMRKSDGYVNATKFCKDAGKLFHDWSRLKSSEEFLNELCSVRGIPLTDLIQTIQGGKPIEQGTYIHPDIAIQIANWCSAKFAVKVSDIIFRYYSGDLFLIRDVVQNYNASHEETKVSKVEIIISKEKELELKEREISLEERRVKLDKEILEQSLSLLDLNDPREKIVAQSLKINAMNYLQRMHFKALGSSNSSEETKTLQELPALSIIVSSLVTVVNKGLKNSVREVIDVFTMNVSKAIAKKYRDLYNRDPPKKPYLSSNGINIYCNLYTSEDEAMIKETILNSVFKFNAENKFRIMLKKL